MALAIQPPALVPRLACHKRPTTFLLYPAVVRLVASRAVAPAARQLPLVLGAVGPYEAAAALDLTRHEGPFVLRARRPREATS